VTGELLPGASFTQGLAPVEVSVMRLTTLIRFAALAAILGLSAIGIAAQDQSSDDVAAAARKSREQQKNAPAPKKVITNDDIPSPKSAATAADSAVSKPAEQGPAASADDKSADNDPKSEAYWRKRFGALHDKLATSEKELDVMQRELDKDQVQYYNDPQKALMQQHDRSDINDKTSKIDAKKKEIEMLKQQLSDLEDDLRKAGGDSGWAR
jgi:predicted RNase H-like nuclease (RuvC/YqgF family)